VIVLACRLRGDEGVALGERGTPFTEDSPILIHVPVRSRTTMARHGRHLSRRLKEEYDANWPRSLVPSGRSRTGPFLATTWWPVRPGETLSPGAAPPAARIRQGNAQGRCQDYGIGPTRRCSSAAKLAADQKIYGGARTATDAEFASTSCSPARTSPSVRFRGG